ncbi:hypothetical protein EC973_002028 [Apophysomyces ossiformis]|uniref:Uncharacterized protein n=1 Tax=Apophysomyces ossiformis TaxID=679940 RepID=A0A8H7BPC7_9FUNG|nr:hypothetical protein EC973_002028 [Apophysomyces ossiformis]
MTATLASKGFPRSHTDTVLDVLLPRYYEYDMNTFRESTRTAIDDPELCMNDDYDAMYTEALLHSEFMHWIDSDKSDLATGFPSSSSSSSSSSTSTSSSCSTTPSSASSLDRLRMVLAHFSQTLTLPPPPSTVTTTTTTTSSFRSPPSAHTTSSPHINVPIYRDVKGKKKA